MSHIMIIRQLDLRTYDIRRTSRREHEKVFYNFHRIKRVRNREWVFKICFNKWDLHIYNKLCLQIVQDQNLHTQHSLPTNMLLPMYINKILNVKLFVNIAVLSIQERYLYGSQKSTVHEMSQVPENLIT